jgi:hypothetical protein
VDELRAALYLDPRTPEIQQQFLAAQRALSATEQTKRQPPGAAAGKSPAATKAGGTAGGGASSALIGAGAKPSQLRTPAQLLGRSSPGKQRPSKPAATPTPARTPKQVRTPRRG